jgi:hypothetical protein
MMNLPMLNATCGQVLMLPLVPSTNQPTLLLTKTYLCDCPDIFFVYIWFSLVIPLNHLRSAKMANIFLGVSCEKKKKKKVKL